MIDRRNITQIKGTVTHNQYLIKVEKMSTKK